MATEVPSCVTETDVSTNVSVLRFINANNNDNSMKLFSEWREALEQLSISPSIRDAMDDWFVDVYNSREGVHRMETDELHNLINDKESKMYADFAKQIQAKISSVDLFPVKLDLQSAFDRIERDFTDLEWVKNAIKCMERECKLIQKYSESPSVLYTREQDQKMEEQITNCEALVKSIDNSHSSCSRELEGLYQLHSDLESQKETLANLTLVLESGVTKNGFTWEKKEQIEAQVGQMEDRQIRKHKFVLQMMMELMVQLTQAVSGFKKLTTDITSEIREWKRQFQFNYAQIHATPDLERISPWCEKTGKMLDELQKLFLQTRNLFSKAGQSWEEHGESYEAELMQIFHDFFQSSFVVVEQEDFVIKVDKKHFPKIVVRCLAAEGLGLGGVKVEAHFVYEDYIVPMADGIDLKYLKSKERKVVGGTADFPNKGKSHRGTFSNMHFKDKDFNREDTTNQMVHDEKYRLVFLMNFKNHDYWTLSLPVVVTTGANQGCRALASIMWQCYSTDVYKVPIERKDELPWCEVAKMVNQKMLRLCPQRPLTEENLAHLKLRLFGKEYAHSAYRAVGGQTVPDDEMVSLKRFCFDKMFKTDDIQCQFSFWKWFLANYNLLDKYLLDYWKKGFIEGFTSKEDCCRKFKTCRSQKNGLFVLRFSDQHITDSQGVKNVFGFLTSAVANMVTTESGEKKKRVVHLEVAGHSGLKNKNLANILKETLDKNQRLVYQYLYPGTKSREEAFDTYCQKGPIVDGYEGTHDAFIVDLEHAVCALNLSTGKHRSPSTDSGIGAASPSPRGCGGKRMRSVEEKHPTLTEMLSRRPLDSPTTSNIDTASHLSTPQPSPAFSAPSPASETRVNPFNDVPLLSGTPGNSPAYTAQSPAEFQMQNSIPKVVEELSSDEPVTGIFVSQNRNNVPQTLTGNQADPHTGSWAHNGNFSQLSFQHGHSQQNQQATHGGHDSSPEDTVIIEIINTDPNECVDLQANDQFQQQMPPCSQSANLLLPTGGLTNHSQDNFTCQTEIIRLLENSPQVMLWLQNMPPNTPAPIQQLLIQGLQPRAEVSSPGPAQVATDNTPDDIQIMNSSSNGSLSQFDSSMIAEAQQMDSGTIDCSVFDDQSF